MFFFFKKCLHWTLIFSIVSLHTECLWASRRGIDAAAQMERAIGGGAGRRPLQLPQQRDLEEERVHDPGEGAPLAGEEAEREEGDEDEGMVIIPFDRDEDQGVAEARGDAYKAEYIRDNRLRYIPLDRSLAWAVRDVRFFFDPLNGLLHEVEGDDRQRYQLIPYTERRYPDGDGVHSAAVVHTPTPDVDNPYGWDDAVKFHRTMDGGMIALALSPTPKGKRILQWVGGTIGFVGTMGTLNLISRWVFDFLHVPLDGSIEITALLATEVVLLFHLPRQGWEMGSRMYERFFQRSEAFPCGETNGDRATFFPRQGVLRKEIFWGVVSALRTVLPVWVLFDKAVASGPWWQKLLAGFAVPLIWDLYQNSALSRSLVLSQRRAWGEGENARLRKLMINRTMRLMRKLGNDTQRTRHFAEQMYTLWLARLQQIREEEANQGGREDHLLEAIRQEREASFHRGQEVCSAIIAQIESESIKQEARQMRRRALVPEREEGGRVLDEMRGNLTANLGNVTTRWVEIEQAVIRQLPEGQRGDLQEQLRQRVIGLAGFQENIIPRMMRAVQTELENAPHRGLIIQKALESLDRGVLRASMRTQQEQRQVDEEPLRDILLSGEAMIEAIRAYFEPEEGDHVALYEQWILLRKILQMIVDKKVGRIFGVVDQPAPDIVQLQQVAGTEPNLFGSDAEFQQYIQGLVDAHLETFQPESTQALFGEDDDDARHRGVIYRKRQFLHRVLRAIWDAKSQSSIACSGRGFNLPEVYHEPRYASDRTSPGSPEVILLTSVDLLGFIGRHLSWMEGQGKHPMERIAFLKDLLSRIKREKMKPLTQRNSEVPITADNFTHEREISTLKKQEIIAFSLLLLQQATLDTIVTTDPRLHLDVPERPVIEAELDGDQGDERQPLVINMLDMGGGAPEAEAGLEEQLIVVQEELADVRGRVAERELRLRLEMDASDGRPTTWWERACNASSYVVTTVGIYVGGYAFGNAFAEVFSDLFGIETSNVLLANISLAAGGTLALLSAFMDFEDIRRGLEKAKTILFPEGARKGLRRVFSIPTVLMAVAFGLVEVATANINFPASGPLRAGLFALAGVRGWAFYNSRYGDLTQGLVDDALTRNSFEAAQSFENKRDWLMALLRHFHKDVLPNLHTEVIEQIRARTDYDGMNRRGDV